MTTIPCPLATCAWSVDDVATNPAAARSADVLSWPAATWSSTDGWGERPLTIPQQVDAHLATHTAEEWIAELRRELERHEPPEAELTRALAVSVFAMLAGVGPQMPSRAEVESAGGCDV